MRRAKFVWAVSVFLCTLVCGPGALAQCGEWDNRFGVREDMNDRVRALTTWDPDGSGPMPAQLVAGGEFVTAGSAVWANGIARWDGAAWQKLGDGLDDAGISRLNALVSWDPDGVGPEAPQLVAGGSFISIGGQGLNSIGRWDGLSWHPTGNGVSGEIFALTTWDPDGDGPQVAQLVAGGRFDTAGGVAVNGIARWDGMAWHAFGSGVGGSSRVVRSLTTWDPDGDGPLQAQLVAGGLFTTAGGVTVNRIARWDGASWQAIGGGMDSSVMALASWDPDGAGPEFARLVAGGLFATAGGATVNGIASWDGSTWQPLSGGVSGIVFSLTPWDSDGAGPQPAELVVGGSFASAGVIATDGVARWNGTAWSAFNAELANGTADALATWDPDGPGPQPAELIVGALFNVDFGVNRYIARWPVGASAWQPFQEGTNNQIAALTMWDADGLGPLSAQLVAGGRFTSAGGVAANRVAGWDGSAWQPLGSGVDGAVRALTTWDPDGSGPLPEWLVAGGYFTTAGGMTVNHIARWDGVSWQPLGSGMDRSGVYALTTWDPDGAGPQTALLVAGGEFFTAGGVTASHIARWDGTSWQAFGSGMSNRVTSLTTWDPDGPGPLHERLVAGGNFFQAGGVTAYCIASWNGTSWSAIGSGLGVSNYVNALAVWDPDGSGPQVGQLVAGGDFFVTSGGIDLVDIARWDGTAWRAFAGSLGFGVDCLATWDPDGSGPLSAQLIAGGSYFAFEVPLNYIARWDGAAWQPFGSGVGGDANYVYVLALLNWDMDGAGPQPSQLVAGGDFTTASGLPAGYMALWSTLAPEIVTQPADDSVSPGATVHLTVSARNGQPTYQWREGGVDLVDGPTGSGSDISGATTATLSISNAQPTDSGNYGCAVANSCGTTTSDPAVLLVSVCPGDANDDRLVNSADLSVLLAQFGLSVTPSSGADFNSDGLVNAADLSVLLAAFGSSC